MVSIRCQLKPTTISFGETISPFRYFSISLFLYFSILVCFCLCVCVSLFFLSNHSVSLSHLPFILFLENIKRGNIIRHQWRMPRRSALIPQISRKYHELSRRQTLCKQWNILLVPRKRLVEIISRRNTAKDNWMGKYTSFELIVCKMLIYL